MKKKIFYWSPCLNKVGTVISAKNSAMAMARYKKNNFDIIMINACGEWDEYSNELKDNGVQILNLSKSYYKFLPKEGFLQSRFSYWIIFLVSFFPLLKNILKNKPDYLIMHLITSLPILISLLFNIKTKFILRISGLPKLNILRKFIWKISNTKIHKVTCPTKELLEKLVKENIFLKKKIYFLPDAIINLQNFFRFKNTAINEIKTKKKIILAAGRLTKQKNFSYLIKEYYEFSKNVEGYDLVILGDGEEHSNLKKLIFKLNIEDKVHLAGRVSNVYNYMQKSKIFVLSSLWEELGFVIVEAAFNNLFVISSDCPNGPKEFINKDCGILFKNNEVGALKNALLNYNNEKNHISKILNAKKKSKNYTKFQHHLKLLGILNN